MSGGLSEFRFRHGVRLAIVGSGLPYGYTITTFASGQAVIHIHGSPPVGLLLLFAAGAGAAYNVLRWLARGIPVRGRAQLGESPRIVRSGAIQAVAIVCAVLAAAAAARLPELEAWPAASFVATLAYLGVVAIELALIEREPTLAE